MNKERPSIIQYKGYTAKIKYDTENKILYAITDQAIIHSHGKNIKELKQSFQEGVETYISIIKVIDK